MNNLKIGDTVVPTQESWDKFLTFVEDKNDWSLTPPILRIEYTEETLSISNSNLRNHYTLEGIPYWWERKALKLIRN